jgi:hypothetical protein
MKLPNTEICASQVLPFEGAILQVQVGVVQFGHYLLASSG